MSKAKDMAKAMWKAKDVVKDIPIGTSATTTTIRTWTKKRDDGTVETTTTKDFTIKPSRSGAKYGAMAGAAAGGVIGNYLPFVGGTVCAVIGAIAGGIAGWIFGPA